MRPAIIFPSNSWALTAAQATRSIVPSQKFATLFEPDCHCEGPERATKQSRPGSAYGPRLLRFARNDEDHIYTTNFRTEILGWR
jgi:hypothetical protein